MKTGNWEDDNEQEVNNNTVTDNSERDSGFQNIQTRKEGNHEEQKFTVVDQEDDGEIDYN